MTPGELHRLISQRISGEGPLPFDVYMEMALYEPGLGYYSGGRVRSDWDGDFITSPQVDPAYGELWAEGVRRLWNAAGEPERFDVVEVGPGEGGFTETLQATLGTDGPFHFTLVEPIPGLADRQKQVITRPERTTWVEDVEHLPRMTHAVIFVNEILDNLPVALVEGTAAGARELYVVGGDDGFSFLAGEVRSETRACMEASEIVPVPGSRYEVPLRAEGFVRALTEPITTGAVIFIDYGYETAGLVDRPAGTLICYSRSGVDDDPLKDPGSKDITAHANWTSIRKALETNGATVTGPVTQREVLRSLGSASIDRRLREDYEAAMTEKRGADGVRALARRQGLGALLAPGGLGSFGVMAGLKGLQPSGFLSAHG